MTYKITLASLTAVIRKARFVNKGDANEQKYWPLFKERFPACEKFWQQFIVPASKWVELNPEEQGGGVRREGVSDDVLTIGFRHYSMFVQLGHAAEHLRLPVPSSFANFYTHLDLPAI